MRIRTTPDPARDGNSGVDAARRPFPWRCAPVPPPKQTGGGTWARFARGYSVRECIPAWRVHPARQAAPAPRPTPPPPGGGRTPRGEMFRRFSLAVTSEASRPSLPCCRGRDRLGGGDGSRRPARVRAPRRGRAPISLALVPIAISLLAASPLTAQRCPDPSLTLGTWPPASYVRYLADDALEGRLAGSAGERCAGDYIAAQFQHLGLEPAGERGTYFQSLPLASAVNPHATGGTGRNVIALLPGSDTTLMAEAIVIGAHYDHLGHGGAFSMAPGDTSIHNGADDNASGVAAMLDAARRLVEMRPARTIVFVAFTGEEEGLLGSSFYAEHPSVPLSRTRAMLNLDMVGRLEDGPLLVYGVDTADEWRAMVDSAAATEGIQVRGGGDGFGASDQTSFYARGVPVLHFFTNVHADYHRPSDDFEKIDSPGLEHVAAIVAEVAAAVSARTAPLTFHRAAAPPPSSSGGGYGAYLGSIPDFTPVPDGVKLTGVRAGSPADKAGIGAGDVIVRLGEMEVHDLQGLTDALRAHRPGDTVRVDVLREGRRITVTATLGARGG
jgi:hypothetical protein